MDNKDSPNFFQLIFFAILLVFLMVFFYLFISERQSFLHEFARTYGLLGIFLGAMIANATLFLPVPFDAVIFFVGGDPTIAGFSNFNFVMAILVAVLGGLGAAVGEMSGYITGLTGVSAAEKFKHHELTHLNEVRVRLKKYGLWFVMFGSMIPFPFDIIGITAGAMKFDFKKFMFATAIGKTVRYMVVIYAGHLGFEIVKTIFSLG